MITQNHLTPPTWKQTESRLKNSIPTKPPTLPQHLLYTHKKPPAVAAQGLQSLQQNPGSIRRIQNTGLPDYCSMMD